MKRALLLPLIICFACTVYGQVVVRQETTDSTELRYSGHIYNGDIFTPKGDFRALIVFISYGEQYDWQDVPGWPQNSPFPEWAIDTVKKTFYSDYSEFQCDVFSDTNRFFCPKYKTATIRNSRSVGLS